MEARYRGSSSRNQSVLPVGSYYDTETCDVTKRKRRSSNNEPLFASEYSPLVLVLLLVVVVCFVKYADNRLPAINTEADAVNLPSSFIGERAWKDLVMLTSYGPRVCGSHENDVRTVEAILGALYKIRDSKLAVYNLEIEVKRPSGAFEIDFLDDVFTNSYQNIPIIIAKLEPINTYLHSNDSILLNCHFDSVPASPGASDDMISCTVMLEILRVLSKQPKPLRNTIIFLFNGAEENFLPGSHGFVAGQSDGSPDEVGHPWKNEIRTVINLEACGAGGREIMFQTGPGNGWLVEAYAKSAKYPFGTSIGEEIFQRGLIPSDTDFRVFRDFLKVPGLDFAFIKNGWVYHTKYDSVESIPQGSLQNMGTNILGLTQTLGNLDFREVDMNSHSKMVFTDVFGFFMIVYTENTGIVLNLIVSLATLYLIWKDLDMDTFRVLSNVGITILAWVSGFIIACVVALMLDFFKYPMPYYSFPSLVYLLYGIPTLVIQVIVYTTLLKGMEDQTWMAAKSALALMILLMTFFTRLAFVLTINVGFGVVGWIVARRAFRDSQRRMLLYLLIGELVPLALSFYYSTCAVDVFVPIMGRSGIDTMPNLILGLYTAFTLSIPGMSGIVPIFVFFKRSFLRMSALIYVGVIAFVVFGVGRIPYRDMTPMRLHIVDVDRNVFGKDHSTVIRQETGLWFFNLDPNTPKLYPVMRESVPEIGQMVTIDNQDCDDLYCGLPLFFSITKLVRYSQWIPKSRGLPAEIKSRVNMEITQDQFLSQSRRRVTFSFSGPDHITIVLSPGSDYELIKWSLTPEIPKPRTFFQGRPTYFIKHGRGIQFERFEITCDFERIASGGTTTSPLVDINLSSFSIHGTEMQTESLQEFVRRLPSWTTTLAFSSVVNLYSVD